MGPGSRAEGGACGLADGIVTKAKIKVLEATKI